MSRQMFSYILHKDGVVDDTALEMVTAAKKLDPESSNTAIVMGAGEGLDSVCREAACFYSEVWKIDNEALFYPNAEMVRMLLGRIIPRGAIVLMPHEHFGMDLGPGLSIKLDSAYLADVVDLEGMEGAFLNVVRQEYNGQVNTRVACDISAGVVITLRPGSFEADEPEAALGLVVDESSEALEGVTPEVRRRFLGVVEAEIGDVDITKADVLVSVGRGIENKDNLSIIFDLAKAMGGEVSCSRPIVDSNWLEKSRQVGTSGQTVKPKVYMWRWGLVDRFNTWEVLRGIPS